jgi:hypothetical protein
VELAVQDEELLDHLIGCYFLKRFLLHAIIYVKVKAIPITDHGDSEVCRKSRLPHSLDSRLADVGEVVSLTRRPPFTPRKIPGTHFC